MNSIIETIMEANDMDCLNDIQNALNLRREELQQRAKLQYKVGDSVYFISSKERKKISGTVYKISRKYIQIKVDDFTIWKVSPTMLRKG